MDKTTGVIEEFPTITPSANPYGIITDKQGNAWFAELRGHHIGKVDAQTGKVTEYAPLTNESGPRRMQLTATECFGLLSIMLEKSQSLILIPK